MFSKFFEKIRDSLKKLTVKRSTYVVHCNCDNEDCEYYGDVEIDDAAVIGSVLACNCDKNSLEVPSRFSLVSDRDFEALVISYANLELARYAVGTSVPLWKE